MLAAVVYFIVYLFVSKPGEEELGYDAWWKIYEEAGENDEDHLIFESFTG